MNEMGMSVDEVRRLLVEARSRDLRYERVLSSMCTTPHPIAAEAHLKFIEANLGDPGLFPGTWDIERDVVDMLGRLLGYPHAAGYITTGGTESNIQAIRIARNKAGKNKPNIILSWSAHFSFEKAGNVLGVEMRYAPLDEEKRMDVSQAEDLIDENTIALVGIAGTTEYGQVDPMRELSDLAEQQDIFLHVDAAFGGMILPFLDRRYDFDFRLPGVESITIDPHKMGMGTIPGGGLLLRDPEYLDLLEINTPYLTTKKQYSLTGTRSGASVAATYAVLTLLGMDGYRKIVSGCMDNTYNLVSGMRRLGFEPVLEPIMNVVCFHVPDLPEVNRRLKERGWQVSSTRVGEMRIVVMPHTTSETIDLFLRDVEEVIRA